MFERPHHQRIAQVLAGMNADLLRDAKCYFGGGTAIALLLKEYRESVDIDFLCADQDGYRMLRESVFDHGLGELFKSKIETLRDVRADRDGIRTILVVEGTPIKFEIVREARISLAGEDVPGIPVPCLCRDDMYAEKLLANADRYGDKAVMSRDAIDLLIMEQHWGPIPKAAWDKASGAYGDSVHVSLRKAKDQLRAERGYLNACLEKMGITEDVGADLRNALGIGRSKASSLGR